MIADRRRLRLLIPDLQVLVPQLALDGHGARFQALGELRIGAPELVPDVLRWVADRILGRADRPRAVVGEAVDELTIEVVEEKPVALQGFPESANELLGEDLGLEAGYRSRPVGVVEGPGSRPRGLKLQFRHGAHSYSSLALPSRCLSVWCPLTPAVPVTTKSCLILLFAARVSGDLLHAVRVPTKLVDQDAYRPGDRLPGLLAREVPVNAHHLPRSAVHENAHHRARASRVEWVESRGHVFHRLLDQLVSTTPRVLVDLSMNPREQPGTYQGLVLVKIREESRHVLREFVDALWHLAELQLPVDPIRELLHQRFLGREMAVDRGHGDAGPLSRAGKRELLKPLFEELLGSRLEDPLAGLLHLLGAERAVVGAGRALVRLIHAIHFLIVLL